MQSVEKNTDLLSAEATVIVTDLKLYCLIMVFNVK